MRSNILIGLVLISCVVATWLFGQFYQELLAAYEQNGTLTQSEYSWVFRLLLNCTGYSTVLLPAFILYKYLQKTNYFDKISNNTWVSRILYACFAEQNERLPESIKPLEEGKRETLELLFCFCGLMGAYLVWGLLQEKIMTQDYVLADGAVLRFSDSQLLVFVNRLSAFLVALGRLLGSGQRVLPAPLYQFSYCALTNVLSAWCQYEALKYVSFPTQVLSKSCKVIPVMVMGKVISRNKYEPHEYGTALLISVGMAMFLYGSRDTDAVPGWPGWSGASGAALLALYLSCDSFTAAWQGGLFARYPLRPLQMMCAVTLCSCVLTAAALLRAPPAPTRAASRALLQHPGFLADCLLLSGSSALGQVLIYHTIARFGAVVFTIIMTLRQAVSILVSCAVYGHAVSATGALGVLLVFAAVLLRVHCRRRSRERARERAREREREREPV